ncbi:hypothetical protein [Paenibacillus beijingensis]|uniref:hypothetical protein n=1 Tax=Paenibacillus beijingensis TaxID=1126833 RepID=UPI0011DC8792|nr:hypothetical protein [Paenibacillus beijingensis]
MSRYVLTRATMFYPHAQTIPRGNGQEIAEIVYEMPNVNRKAVTFACQLDPLFIIRYNHMQGIQS